ncbi:hypothetical protein EC968_008748 [Mortierella alpina]|nr:hypothetical protein EC968_008748 [Mortierella alpina]
MSAESETKRIPTVLISGAGLGGLMMGALLERINVPYHIFERATKVKPLGAVMSLSANILPVFEQLGLMEELEKFSLPCPSHDLYNGKLQKLGSVHMKHEKDITGYESRIFARPRLHELMLKQIPEEKITMGKRILRVDEKDDHVLVHCSDGSTYRGDILIGADGAYSGVRQSLYKYLDEHRILPKSDLEDLSIGYTCMVGVASPKDVDKYPQLKEPYAYLSSAVGGNRQIFKSVAESKEQQFRNSEWGPEANETMIKQFYDLPCPYGGVMGDLIDATPKELISKVFVEEKMFKTWFYGRTVLIGDACHKMLPGGGQGAVNAMQDAVILANCLYDLVDATPKGITAAFQDYYDQRFHHAKAMLENSQLMSRAMGGQNMLERLFRHILLNYIPEWLQQRSFEQKAEYRPQVAFLPMVATRGTGHVLPLKPSRRYKEEQQASRGACCLCAIPVYAMLRIDARTSSPLSVSAPAVARTATKLYVVGGNYTNSLLSQFYSLDLAVPWNKTQPAWTRLADGPKQELFPAVFSSDGKTLITFHSGTLFAMRYNVDSNTWTSAACRPAVNYQGVSAVTDPNTGLAYLAAGYTGRRDTMSVYNFVTDKLASLPGGLPVAGGLFKARAYYGNTWCKYRNSIIYFGGYDAALHVVPENVVTEYRPDTNAWSTMCRNRQFVPRRVLLSDAEEAE